MNNRVSMEFLYAEVTGGYFYSNIMKRKFKHWWTTTLQISIQRAITSRPKPQNTTKIM